MKAIGGYFELELKKLTHYHEDAVKINSARNCLEIILILRKWRRLYIPFYTCEAILQPIERQNVKYEFYSIDERLDPSYFPRLKKDEAFLYTNYFGLKQDTIVFLKEHYGEQLIVDNAQAFYAPRLKGIDTFYSPRKYFGVPDGGYLYTDLDCGLSIDTGSSWKRMSHLFKRIDQSANDGYLDFQQAELSLNYAPIERMSKLTDALLSSIDYNDIAAKRHNNFVYLKNSLDYLNAMRFEVDDSSIPMVYPLFTNRLDLRDRLLSNNIYTATYWRNVHKWCCKQYENRLAEQLIPLPIDQRYSESDLNLIISSILL